jgi:hypothetical protein
MPLPKKVNGTHDPYHDPTSIGNLAVQKGYATRAQVLTALKRQEERLPLGEILVEQGILTVGQLEDLLMEQEIMRRRMTAKQAAQYVKSKRREQVKELTRHLRSVTESLVLAKT